MFRVSVATGLHKILSEPNERFEIFILFHFELQYIIGQPDTVREIYIDREWKIAQEHRTKPKQSIQISLFSKLLPFQITDGN